MATDVLYPNPRLLYTDQVTIYRARLVSSGAYGKKRDWDNMYAVYEGPACVQPDRAFEARTPERETAQERLLVYLPSTADVTSEDRVDYMGMTFEVDGDPQEWRHMTVSHIRIRIWKAEH